MKKVSLCIGVFIVLFLAIGVHTVKAQDLSGLNGQWLNGTLKVQKGWVTDRTGTTSCPRKDAEFYGEVLCVCESRGWISNAIYVR